MEERRGKRGGREERGRRERGNKEMTSGKTEMRRRR
jgi:hypothetical protein